jgi:glycerophosphoryl diester phosphodiesterase
MARVHPFLDAPGPVAIAHRGGDTPAGCENTLAAFAHAVDLGFRYLETDVRLSADGVLVCLHDPTLDRVSGDRGPVSERTWSDLRTVRIGGREPVARFDEVLEAFPGTRLVVEPKTDTAVPALVASIRGHQAERRVCVGSFSLPRLRRVRLALGPNGCTSTGPAEARALRLASLRLRPLRSVPSAPSCVQVPISWGRMRVVDRRFVSTAHRLGLPVHVWTVNDAHTMRELLDLGVDGIITDAVASLRAVLEERGAWHGG